MKFKSCSLVLMMVLTHVLSLAQETISFQASDGISITADLYFVHQEAVPFILLFHQANCSRGEYLEIAPKLNAMGYNCMAVDLRSGGTINGIPNKTKLAATNAMKSTNYVDALLDIEAAIAYAKENIGDEKLVIWGSSYSAALALKIAGDDATKVDAVVAFSPGEYFSALGRSSQWITASAEMLTVPVFITSARNEKQNWWSIYEAIPSESKYFFLPTTSGNHGSRALWESFTDSKSYWEEVRKFLSTL